MEKKIIINDKVKSLEDIREEMLLEISPKEAKKKRRLQRGVIVNVNKRSNDVFVYTRHEIPREEIGKYVGGLLEIHYKIKRKKLREIRLQSYFIFDNGFNEIHKKLNEYNLLL
jgi:hypothetical protein